MAKARSTFDYILYTCPKVFPLVFEIDLQPYLNAVERGEMTLEAAIKMYGRKCASVAQENGAENIRAAFERALDEGYERELALEKEIRSLKAKITRMEKKNGA